MHRLYLLVPFLLFAALLAAQPSLVSDLSEQTCSYDSTVTGLFPTAYEVFYTRDDTYDGPIDSSYCVSFSLADNNPYYGRLDTAGLPPNRPLYIRYRFPEGDSLPLLPYTGYSVVAYLSNYASDRAPCVDNFCNGLRLEYTVRDSASGQSFLRQREFSARDRDFRFGENCLVTERFEQQWVTSITQRVALVEAASETSPALYGFDVYELGSLYPVRGLEVSSATPDTAGVFESSFQEALTSTEVRDFYTYYLRQAEEGIPAADNIAYTDVTLSPNVDTQSTIRLVFYPFAANLEIPPFTALRGGLVAGQDSLRHRLVLEYREGYQDFTYCGAMIVEQPVPPDVTVTFETRELRFGAGLGCFLLEPKAALRVQPQSALHYGVDGAGMLVLYPGSRLELSRGATLVIDNHVQLQHHLAWGPAASAVDLQPGSRLVFGPAAKLTSKYDKKEAYLDLYMNGGSVDVSALDAEALTHLRYIYPEAARPQVQRLSVYPNPAGTSGAVKLAVPVRLLGRPGTVVVVDGAGRRMLTQAAAALAEEVDVDLPGGLPAGVYHLRLTAGAEVVGTRLVLLD